MGQGLILMRRQRFEESLARFRSALAGFEQSGPLEQLVRAHHNMARSYLGLREYVNALEHFTKASYCLEEALARTGASDADRAALRSSLPDCVVTTVVLSLALAAHARRAGALARARALHTKARILVRRAQHPELEAELRLPRSEP